MRKLGIYVIPEQQAKVLSGERDTWIWCQHLDIKLGDEAEFLDPASKTAFAVGKISELRHVTVNELTAENLRRSVFADFEDLIGALRTWDSNMDWHSPVTVMRFDSITAPPEPRCPECDERDQT